MGAVRCHERCRGSPWPFNCGWHLILFCKSLLWLLDFLSSKLNKGIFSIITVSKQTTGVSAFRRGCGIGPRVERYCCNSVFDLGGSLWTWVASWNEAGRCCWQGSGEEQYPAEPFPASVPAWLGQIPWNLLRLPICSFTVHLGNSENRLKPSRASISGILLWFKAKCISLFAQVSSPGHPPPPWSLLWALWSCVTIVDGWMLYPLGTVELEDLALFLWIKDLLFDAFPESN